MPLNFNNVAIGAINFNGVAITSVNFNGVNVWSSGPKVAFSPNNGLYLNYFALYLRFDGSLTYENSEDNVWGSWSNQLELNKDIQVTIKNNGGSNSTTQDLYITAPGVARFNLKAGLTQTFTMRGTALSNAITIETGDPNVTSGSFTLTIGSSSDTFTITR